MADLNLEEKTGGFASKGISWGSTAEEKHKNGYFSPLQKWEQFTSLQLDRNQGYTIGRAKGCCLQALKLDVSRAHCRLEYRSGAWQVRDGGPDDRCPGGWRASANGTYVNGRRLPPGGFSILYCGDVVFAAHCPFIMGIDCLKVPKDCWEIPKNTQEDSSCNCAADTRRIPERDTDSSTAVQNYMARETEPLSPVNKEPIELAPPPEPHLYGRVSRFLREGKTAVTFTQLLLGNADAQREFFPAAEEAGEERRRERRDREKAEEYQSWLESVEQEIERRKEHETFFLRETSPSAKEILTEGHLPLARRPDNGDFLSIRLGVGKLPSAVKKNDKSSLHTWQFDAPKNSEERKLLDRLRALTEREELLRNVPITISLRDNPLISLTGAKPKEDPDLLRKAEGAVRNAVLLLAAEHFCTDVKIVLLAETADAAGLEFLRFLPHNWTDNRERRLCADTVEQAGRIAADILNQMANERGNRPVWVVLALSRKLLTETMEFKKLMEYAESGRSGVCFLTAGFDPLPQFRARVVPPDARGLGQAVGFVNGRHGDILEDAVSEQFLPDPPTEDEAAVWTLVRCLWTEASVLFSFSPAWPEDSEAAHARACRGAVRFLDNLGSVLHTESDKPAECTEGAEAADGSTGNGGSAPSKLVHVLVPRMLRAFTVLVPEDMDAAALRRLLEAGVRELEGQEWEPGQSFDALAFRCPDRHFPPGWTLRECGIGDGAQIVLL